MMWDHPRVGKAYVTENGLLYYVLLITFDKGKMRMKYFVLSDELVNPKLRKLMMDVGEVGEYTGPANLNWNDRLIM